MNFGLQKMLKGGSPEFLVLSFSHAHLTIRQKTSLFFCAISRTIFLRLRIFFWLLMVFIGLQAGC